MSFLRSALLFICWMTPLFDVRKLPARIDMWICSPLKIDHRENVTIIGVKWVSFKKVISHQFAGGSDLESMVFYRWTKWIINHRNYPQFIYFHLHKVLPAAPRAWSPWFHVFFIPRPAEFIKNTSSICLCLNPSLAKFNTWTLWMSSQKQMMNGWHWMMDEWHDQADDLNILNRRGLVRHVSCGNFA